MSSPKLPAISGDDLPEIRPAQWILSSLLLRGAGTIIAGQPGVSKSIHAAIISACVTLGRDFGEFECPTATGVLWVDFEENPARTLETFRAVYRGLGVETIPQNMHFFWPDDELCRYPDGGYPPSTLNRLGKELAMYVKDNNIGTVVVDSLMSAMEGDALSARDVVITLRSLKGVLRSETAVLLIDHNTKGVTGSSSIPTPFGSQAKRSWARVSIAMEAEKKDGDVMIRWSIDKANVKGFVPFWTKINFRDEGGTLREANVEFHGRASPRDVQKLKNDKRRAAETTILTRLTDSQGLRRKAFPEGGTYDRALRDLVDGGQIRREDGLYVMNEGLPPNLSDTTTPDVTV